MLVIRAESPQDRPLIDTLNREAFAGPIEADLIERLRAGGLVVSSLVAADAGIVGHILFSDLDVRVDGRRVAAVALAPMAVRTGEQRRGIGSQLVRAGLDDVRRKGRTAVLVLGHPAYYPRGACPETGVRICGAGVHGAGTRAWGTGRRRRHRPLS